MLIKFFSNGQGGGAAPVNYLIARNVLAYDDSRNIVHSSDGKTLMKRRDPLPEIVSGNPDLTRMLIDCCRHKWSYRAGVVSFAKGDNPTEEQQLKVINTFETLGFAGLEPEQYNILWVRHSHEDRIELHFCTPRQELTTGNSFNIAPPGYFKPFDACRDLMNKKYGWADPEDTSRTRERKVVSESPARAQTREQLQDWIEEMIVAGAINNRSEMIALLKKSGFLVPREGKKYISIAIPDSEIRFRMKGPIYHETWTPEVTLERRLNRENDEDEASANRLDRYRDEELRARYQEHVERRKKYNRKRYSQSKNEMAAGTDERGRVYSQTVGNPAEEYGRRDEKNFQYQDMEPDQPNNNMFPSLDLGANPANQLTDKQREPHNDEYRKLPATIDDTTRERVTQIRRRIDSIHGRANNFSKQFHRLLDSSVSSARSISYSLSQLSKSVQHGIDWLGKRTKQSTAHRHAEPSHRRTETAFSGRFVAIILQREKRKQEREREPER
ncbi:relaxase/mobilization nuclease domain-containing protein [Cohaesibacter celericrescens]|uniref:Mobilization relaxase n=1 Tax=Cohaesibacter celericrescens TaxID=2067669 RepID=A0A2N5XTA2_9HYPH|nr:relaxase/mobilization nuclease domain-containing protein [Cohaesibacter celericrescens]PLW77687.1 mobilization relaxase [Cohaesibacter celericrescens]